MPVSESPLPRGEGSHGGQGARQLPATSLPLCLSNPLSSLPMLLVVAMVTSLQDEILVSTRTGALGLCSEGEEGAPCSGDGQEGAFRLEPLAHTSPGLYTRTLRPERPGLAAGRVSSSTCLSARMS